MVHDVDWLRVYIDAEFTDFVEMHLISLGVVADTGEEFYAELNDYPQDACNTFVQESVVPLLGQVTTAVMSRQELRDRLFVWLDTLRQKTKTVIVCYDFFGDYALFVEALGAAPDWLRADNIRDRLDPSAHDQYWNEFGMTRHYALHDARALRCAYHRKTNGSSLDEKPDGGRPIGAPNPEPRD